MGEYVRAGRNFDIDGDIGQSVFSAKFPDKAITINGKAVDAERIEKGFERDIYSVPVILNGKDASAQIISRSVAKNNSEQIFKPTAVGNADCKAHVQCDSIIMDNARISSVPAITANNADAQIVHEAAIGRINNDQLLKLMTFGMNEEEAENVIVQGFLA